MGSVPPSSCFISNPAVFFGAFLGPIFLILLFNIVIFAVVIMVLIKHSWKKDKHSNKHIRRKRRVSLLINIAAITFLFGLTWLFGALTVTGFADPKASTAFQFIFVILNAFQGFFIFLFFCVINKDARESWLEVFSCGCCRNKSKSPQSSQSRYVKPCDSSQKTTTDLSSTNPSVWTLKSDTNGEKCSEITLTYAAENPNEDEEELPQVHGTDIDTDKRLESLENKREEVLKEAQKSDSKMCDIDSSQWREDGIEVKARIKRYSTKKAYKHHVMSAEVDFF